jgi:hypothetical protein
VVTRIESDAEYKEIALGVFLGIEGAFGRSSFDALTQTAGRHGIEPTICRWVYSTLVNRNVVTTLSGETLRASTAKGCPQGGVLSPLLWSLVVDALLWELNENYYYTIRYADDMAILIDGKFPEDYLRGFTYSSRLFKNKIDIVGGGVQLGPLGTAAIDRPIVPAPVDSDVGEIGGMIGKGNRSTRRKPAPMPLCPPQTPHAARTRTRAAAVGSQRLTA